MNIALFDAAKYWSGGAQRVYLCAKGFKEKGHNVVLICLPTSRLNKLLNGEVKIYNIHPVFDLDILAALKIFYILVKHNINVLDIHSPKFYWLGVFIGKILGKKIFITRNVEYRKRGIKKIINRYLYKLCDGIVCVSEKIKKIFEEDFKIPSKNIKVIYGGILIKDLKELKNIRSFYKISKETFVLSIIGRIERNKGQDFAIQVLDGLVNNKGYNCVLFIIGAVEEKKYFEYLNLLIRKMKLENRVIFTGFVENVEDFIVSSDVVLCCSFYEGVPRSIVESLMLFTPVVSTPVIRKEEIPLPINNLEELIHIIKRNVGDFIEEIEKIFKYFKKPNYYDLVENYKYLPDIEEYINFYKK